MTTLLVLCLRVAGAALRIAARVADPKLDARAAREAKRQAWRRVDEDLPEKVKQYLETL